MSQKIFSDNALEGKSVLITGGGGGLGKEIALGLARAGATVHICGRRQGMIETTATEIASATDSLVIGHACDVRDPDSIEALMDSCWQHGPLTGLVNNAAANFIAPTHTLSPRAYRAITSTVMDGSFYATLAIGKRWIEQGLKGSIVSNLVTWVWTGSAFVVPSAMAKTALHAMTMSLAVEWGQYGIRLNATAPGPFPTEGAWEKLNPLPDRSSSATSFDTIPMGRFGDMEELRNLLTFLMSDACEFITGQTIAIDGGQHLASPSTFADLGSMSEADWKAARESIEKSTAAAKQQQK